MAELAAKREEAELGTKDAFAELKKLVAQAPAAISGTSPSTNGASIVRESFLWISMYQECEHYFRYYCEMASVGRSRLREAF